MVPAEYLDELGIGALPAEAADACRELIADGSTCVVRTAWMAGWAEEERRLFEAARRRGPVAAEARPCS